MMKLITMTMTLAMAVTSTVVAAPAVASPAVDCAKLAAAAEAVIYARNGGAPKAELAEVWKDSELMSRVVRNAYDEMPIPRLEAERDQQAAAYVNALEGACLEQLRSQGR